MKSTIEASEAVNKARDCLLRTTHCRLRYLHELDIGLVESNACGQRFIDTREQLKSHLSSGIQHSHAKNILLDVGLREYGDLRHRNERKKTKAALAEAMTDWVEKRFAELEVEATAKEQEFES